MPDWDADLENHIRTWINTTLQSNFGDEIHYSIEGEHLQSYLPFRRQFDTGQALRNIVTLRAVVGAHRIILTLAISPTPETIHTIEFAFHQANILGVTVQEWDGGVNLGLRIPRIALTTAPQRNAMLAALTPYLVQAWQRVAQW